ncbi:energy-coupling factor transporter transmembrane component T family protein [Haloarcula argentinensis]|uniref:Energy-coupling factor transporter transmembrane protein EcfT n=1 Tax=Haloarcula argentinensis TaxID=43776 RepID=A0ABU2F4V7_HALAR|nr:energy-coupling factor transporter transmembrane component T [Haloarcula argentinensis]EMA17945.1 cobalt transport protein [Haloarcula argentinensis DSM 12282]MDS0255599.1 energy-coupling factor transporter transmembrane protein EcfT [Haloarcula argentinensis]
MTTLDTLRDATSVEAIKSDLLRTAYENEGSFLHRLDPRVLLLWYVVFLFVPWLFYDTTVLLGLLAFVSVLAVLSRVSLFLVGLMAFTVATTLGSYAVVTVFTGDPVAAIRALIPYTLKLTIISVSSLAVFSSMGPKTLSQGLRSLGIPRQFTFLITYGYRMLPVLFQEYHDLVNSFRLRSTAPDSPGRFRWRHYAYLLKLSVRAFYPMIFNVAKRSRVTVEAMEARGFSHSLANEASTELRLADMQIRPKDVGFFAGSLFVVAALALFL